MTASVGAHEAGSRLRIALVTPWRFDDPRAWSGMIPRIHDVLSEVADVVPISTADQPTALIDRVAAKILGMVSSRSYMWDFGVATVWSRGRAARRRIRRADVDVVFGVVASTDLALIGDVGVPIVQMSDATYKAMSEFYPLFSNLHPLSSLQATYVAEKSTRRSDAFVLSSQWAIDSLVQDYAVGTHQCVLAPTGPGIDPPADPAPRTASSDALRALLVSSNWQRKGGDIAVDAIRRAREHGAPVSLTIVGDAPTGLPEWVQTRGRLTTVELSREYQSADVLIELASANAAGVTLTDAAAHALPVIATDVGGVASIVRDGETGFLIAAGPDVAESAADALIQMREPELRNRLSAAARKYWETDLNWNEWARRVLLACRQAVERVE